MKNKIAILGSTGSIGKSLLKIISKDKKNFEIVLLSANKNYKEIIKQSRLFNVRNIILKDKKSFEIAKEKLKKNKIKLYNDYDSFNKIFNKKIEYVMSSIVGIDGLYPTYKIIKHTKKIAIANKESIICGWNLIYKELKKNKTKFMPVDSEHFSIWYALENNLNESISKIYLTASGGSLLNVKKKNIKNLSLKSILKHPNWSMGNKITIDSSTLMNKVFEVIETKKIFNLKYNQIKIIIHKDSYVHAIIKLSNGMIKIIAHDTTMEIPIGNTLYDSKFKFKKKSDINIKKLNKLNLKSVDFKKFVLVETLKKLPPKDSLFETVLVSANDELVHLYLSKKIKYIDISSKLIEIINKKEFKKFKKILPRTVSEVINLSKIVRLKIREIIWW